MYRYLSMKSVSAILIIAILFQSCAVYERNSVTLEQAEKTHKRVLMTRTNDEKVKLKKVELVDGKYYGVATIHKRQTKVPLDDKDIKSLRPINSLVTTLGNIGIIFAAIAVIVVAAALSDPWEEMDFGDSNTQF